VKVGTVALLVLVAVVAGGLWLKQHDRWVRETAAATRSRDSLALAIADERAERAGRHTRDSIESARKLRERDAELRYARLRADSLQAVLGPLIDSLGPMLPDTMSAFVSRLVAAWRAQNEAWQAERAQVDTTIAAYVARITELEAARASDLNALNRQIDECVAQLDRALKRASPSILTRVVRALPWLGGAAATGYIVGHLSK